MSYLSYWDDESPRELAKSLSNLEGSAFWFEEIVDILYGNIPYNEKLLEDTLEELSGHLGVKIPGVYKQNLKFERRGNHDSISH